MSGFAPILAQAAETTIPTQSLFDTLVAGGPLMIPILLASFAMLLIVFERTFSLRRRRVVPRVELRDGIGVEL